MKKQFTINVLTTSFLIFFVFLPSVLYSTIIYVNKNAVGANNGSNWNDAYNNLSDALQVALPGDEIWVATGVYKPHLLIDFNSNGDSDPREASFSLPDGVQIYGGFNGSEINREERNWLANLTILSGDIDNNDLNTDANFIAESVGDIVGNNAYHVIFTQNVSSSTRLDGFVITAGKADITSPVNVSDPNLDGGGWYNKITSPILNSSPIIANTSFIGNYAASEGGAMYNHPGPSGSENFTLIENCIFSNNKSNNSGGALYLGSFSPGNYRPVINNCRFTENEAYRRGGAIYLLGDRAEINSSTFQNNRVTVVSADMSTLPGSGGAVNLVASNANFTSCMFIGNSTTGNPTGAFEGGGGGGIHASTNEPQTSSLGPSEPKFINCGFYQNEASGNTAAWGGAVTNLNDGGILLPKYINCVFSGNYAQNFGGAVANFTRVLYSPSGFNALLNPEFTNCTFFGNNAGQNGGGIYLQGYVFEGNQILESKIENTILWGNTAGMLGGQIHSTGNNFITYSLIEGSGGSGGSWNTSFGTDGGNNIALNPGFINASNPLGADNIPATSDDGLRLLNSSNAVNAGNNLAAGLNGISTDFAGSTRIQSGIIDIGAYESLGFVLPKINIYWLKNWLGINSPCLNCPLPWSFLLFTDFGNKPQFIWNGPAQFIEKDNFAYITGDIINSVNPKLTFKVYLKLGKPMDWENWSKRKGTYFAESKEAKMVAKKEHKNWKYWTLLNDSYIEGTGDIKGILKLSHYNSSDKTAFQMGLGANAWDGDFGIGGKFVFNGKLFYGNKKLQVKGIGNFNVDAVLCIEQCQPLLNDLLANNIINLKSASIEDVSEEDQFRIYPVPANDFLTVDISPLKNNFSVLTIFDLMGREKLVRNLHNNETKIVIPLNNLIPGIYILKATGNNSEPFTKIFIKN